MNIQKTSVCKIFFFRFLLCKVALVQVPVFTQCTFSFFLFYYYFGRIIPLRQISGDVVLLPALIFKNIWHCASLIRFSKRTASAISEHLNSLDLCTSSPSLYNILISVFFMFFYSLSNILFFWSFWVSTKSSKVSVSAVPIRARDLEKSYCSPVVPLIFFFPIWILYLLPLAPSRLRQFSLTVYFACVFLFVWISFCISLPARSRLSPRIVPFCHKAKCKARFTTVKTVLWPDENMVIFLCSALNARPEYRYCSGLIFYFVYGGIVVYCRMFTKPICFPFPPPSWVCHVLKIEWIDKHLL